MSFQPAVLPLLAPFTISTIGRYSLGLAMVVTGTATPASTAWPTANKAFYVPFWLDQAIIVTKLWWANGATVSGNVDCAIYRADLTKLVSTGSTAQATTSIVQSVDITDTPLLPGNYFFGLVLNNTTGRILRFTPGLPQAKLNGITEQTSAFALPDPMVPATPTATYVPLCGLLHARTLI